MMICGCAHDIRVRDEAGKPVAHASVAVVRYSLAADPVGETDAKGKFSFPSTPGLELLDVSHRDFETFHFTGPGDAPKNIVLKRK